MKKFKNYKLIKILLLSIYFLTINNIHSKNIGTEKKFNNYIIKFKQENRSKNLSHNKLDKSYVDIENILSKYNLITSNFNKSIQNSLLNISKNNNLQNNKNIDYNSNFENVYLCENDSKFKEFLKDYENNKLDNIIEYITPNYIYKIDNNITNDTKVNEQWALQKLKANQLWEYATGKGILIGVVDTGIDWFHEDMKNQLWVNMFEDLNYNGKFDNWSVNEIRNGIKGDLDNIDNDNNGFIDDIIGYDFVDQFTFNFGDYKDYDPSPFDENGHGTNVSSVINAENNNNFGISGLAFNSKIITSRSFDATGSGESDDIAAGIIYCALNGAKILNFSFGERFKSPIIEDAIKFAASKGCIMVSSSGNNNWWFEHYPSDLKEVLSVGSSTIEDKKDSFSNYGSFVDVLAPGSKILVASPNNEYKNSSGTSLSSPYVVSLIAMMLEIDSTLNYNNIFSLIKTNCFDIGIEGWDFINSAGIIDPLKTLQNLYKSNISFVDIPNELYLDKTTLSKLDIKANIIEPLFQNYEVKIAQGLYPSEKDFVIIDSGKTQIFGGLIAQLDLNKLKDTLYTLSLVVNRSNKSQVQQRIKLHINSTFNKLTITDKKIYEALKDNKKVLIAHIYTNIDSYIELKYKNKLLDDNYKIVQNSDKFTSNHIIVIEDTLSNIDEFNFEVTVFNNNNIYNGKNNFMSGNFDYKISNKNPFKLDFTSKNYSLPPSYLSSDVKINDKNEKFIITNEYINGAQFGKIYLNKFEKINNSTNIIKVDSLNDLSVNLNIGKINNENFLLTTSEFRNSVYKIDFDNQKFEQKASYQSGNLKREWGGAFIDLDEDGNSELINYNDTNFVVFKYINNNFVEIANTENINKEVIGLSGTRLVPRKLSTKPAFEFGDFGKEKNLFIFEIENILYTYKVELDNNNKINFKFLKKYNYFNSKGRTIKQLQLIDRNGNNKNDIAVLTNGDADFDKLIQVSDNTWTVEILEDQFQNDVEIDLNPLYTERIYGYKDGFISNFGFSYKNNISVVDFGDNTQINQELVLSLTPNLYVIKNLSDEGLQNKTTNISWYPFNFSNEIIYDDFDNNGQKELVVNFFGGLEFLELDKNSIQISGFDGYPINESSAILFWDKNKNNSITDYEIYKIKNIEKGEIELINSTKENSIILNDLIENTEYEFLIRGIDSTDRNNVKIGQFSYPITVQIYPHKPIKPIKVEILDSTQLYLEFSGKLPLNYIDKSKFNINNLELNKELNIFSVLRLNDNKLLINLNEKFVNGNYKLHVKSFDDYYRTPTNEDSLLFRYNFVNKKLLNLVNLEQTDNKLKLFFSDSIDFNNVSLNNFELSPYGTINEVIYNNNESENNKTISNNLTLILDDLIFKNTQGIIYNIKAKKIKSINELEISENEGSSLSFVLRQNALDDVYTLPNPFKYSKNEFLTFGNLTVNSKIEIFDLNGNILKELLENDGDGGVVWDLKDKNNNLLIEGIYLYKITGINDYGENFESELKKFVILP